MIGVECNTSRHRLSCNRSTSHVVCVLWNWFTNNNHSLSILVIFIFNVIDGTCLEHLIRCQFMNICINISHFIELVGYSQEISHTFLEGCGCCRLVSVNDSSICCNYGILKHFNRDEITLFKFNRCIKLNTECFDVFEI